MHVPEPYPNRCSNEQNGICSGSKITNFFGALKNGFGCGVVSPCLHAFDHIRASLYFCECNISKGVDGGWNYLQIFFSRCFGSWPLTPLSHVGEAEAAAL